MLRWSTSMAKGSSSSFTRSVYSRAMEPSCAARRNPSIFSPSSCGGPPLAEGVVVVGGDRSCDPDRRGVRTAKHQVTLCCRAGHRPPAHWAPRVSPRASRPVTYSTPPSSRRSPSSVGIQHERRGQLARDALAVCARSPRRCGHRRCGRRQAWSSSIRASRPEASYGRRRSWITARMTFGSTLSGLTQAAPGLRCRSALGGGGERVVRPVVIPDEVADWA